MMGKNTAVLMITISLIVGAISLVILIITGVEVMKPYRAGRDFNITTECSFLDMKDHGTRECIYSHGRSASENSVPCIQIEVQYQRSDGTFSTGTIFEDIGTYKERKPCSYWRCGSSLKKTEEAIRNIVNRWNNTRSPSTSPCYVNGQDLTQVVENMKFTYAAALVSVLIPTLMIFISLIILIVGCYMDGGQTLGKLKKFFYNNVRLCHCKEKCPCVK